MTAFWVTLGISLLVLGSGVLTWKMPLDPRNLDENQLRRIRKYLEGRRGPMALGGIVVPCLAVVWLVVAIDHIVRGSGRGFLYLIPAILLMLGLWLMRLGKNRALANLGDRGVVPRTRQEEKAKAWYRLWGATLAVGILGPRLIEYFYERPFPSDEAFTNPVSTVHALLTMAVLLGVLGLLITYLNTRENEKASGR